MTPNIQALRAVSVSQQVSANNVANINTNGFLPSRVDFETGPEGQGVRVQRIVEEGSHEARRRGRLREYRRREALRDEERESRRLEEEYTTNRRVRNRHTEEGARRAEEHRRREEDLQIESERVRRLDEEYFAEKADHEAWLAEVSATDLAVEMARMIANEQAFAANVAALRTQMDMQGVLIDTLV
jgi:flagellar basal body rod protein FlgB